MRVFTNSCAEPKNLTGHPFEVLHMIHELIQGIQSLLAGRTAGNDQSVLTEGREVVAADFELDRGD
jgi:hypothetical protein